MSRLSRYLFRIGAVAVFGVAVSTTAAAHRPGICANAVLAPGAYSGLVVSGTCTIDGAVTINGNVRVTPGAYLNAGWQGTQLTINGNVSVGRRATLGLGCAEFYNDCAGPPANWAGRVTVNGNIVAFDALTMYLDSTAVHGNVLVIGGGDLAMTDPNGLVLPIKDNHIDGNIVVYGWQGAWFGIIRNTVGGNVIAWHTEGTRLGDGGALDSTEIATNVIAGDLVCAKNTPPAQIGDSHGALNTVGGSKIGECAGL
jgi:hypothetical protein